MPGFTNPFSSAEHAGVEVKDARLESKRKHRWIFTVFWEDQGLLDTAVYLQSAQRPHAVVEEAVMHHDQEQAYFAGKYHWEPVSLVFYDVGASPGADVNSSDRIYEWFNQVVNVSQATVAPPSIYKKECELAMTDGAGGVAEKWKLRNSWPIDINWNDLDYTNTEIQTIDVSLKYDRAEKE